MSRLDRRTYAALYGPTTGDRVALGDTGLVVEVERDLTSYGDECVFGGGKVLRDQMGQMPGASDDRALDVVITNALVVDWTGIYKADVGIKGGRIVGIGKSGNPLVMSDVGQAMVVGVTTEAIAGEGMILTMCRKLRDTMRLGVVTNDIFTREDAEFLHRNEALPAAQIRAVETGGCPHAAIREDITPNLDALEQLMRDVAPELLLVESGGDNLAAQYSRELVDYTIDVVDVAGGDKVPRKGGPGVTQSDLLIVNKIDLAVHVGASLDVMARDASRVRQGGPVVFCRCNTGHGVDEVIGHILAARTEALRTP